MKTVSDAPDSVDEVLVGTDILELGAEIADVNIKRVIFGYIFFFPYALEEIGLGEDLVGIFKEHL